MRPSIREPLPQAVKAELPEKSCLGTDGAEPNCPLEIELQALSLNPAATELLPLTAVQKTEGEGTGARSSGDSHLHCQMLRPESYDGRSSWDAYHTQFKMLACINSWKEEEMATYLAVSLKGPALTVLNNVPPESLYSYDALVSALVSALETRFGSAHQAELHQVRFKARLRRRDEDLPELAEDIEQLARLAYPQTTQSMLDLLAKDQFVDSLPDEDMRLRIIQSRPSSLREALRVALELDFFQQASQQRSGAVRGVKMEESPQQIPGISETDKNPSNIPQWVDDLSKAIQGYLEQQGVANPQTRPPGVTGRRRSSVCWK